jgi:hypothetical protein
MAHTSGDFVFSLPSPRYSSTGYYSTRTGYTSPLGETKFVSGRSYSWSYRAYDDSQALCVPSSSLEVVEEKSSSSPKATEADARKHHIPPGYSLKNWDPTEEPIMLLGSVFGANSLGKWIYDWTVYHHGPATPISDMAGELWLLLIQLAGKVKRAEECMPRIRTEDNREMVED